MPSKLHGKWTYSLSNEVFNYGAYFDTKEQAVAAGKVFFDEEGDRVSFYVGQCQDIKLNLNVDLDAILDSIHSNVYDEVGEVADGYLNNIKKRHYEELETNLNSVLHKWMKQRGYEPDFHSVNNIEKIAVGGK